MRGGPSVKLQARTRIHVLSDWRNESVRKQREKNVQSLTPTAFINCKGVFMPISPITGAAGLGWAKMGVATPVVRTARKRDKKPVRRRRRSLERDTYDKGNGRRALNARTNPQYRENDRNCNAACHKQQDDERDDPAATAHAHCC